VISAAGNIQHADLLKLVNKAFAFQNGVSIPDNSVVANSRSGMEIFNRSNTQTHICLGNRSYPYSDSKKFPFFIMNTILGGGMSSRLFQSIREKFGYAYSVYTFNEALSDTGVFGVYVGTDKVHLEHVTDLILKEFKEMRNKKISSTELNRIKTQLKGNLMLGLESTSSRMNRLGKMEVYLNEFIYLDDIITKINKVTAEQVREVANELLDPEELLTVVFTPTEAKL
jgi:predicted Zn-dependent peptidase